MVVDTMTPGRTPLCALGFFLLRGLSMLVITKRIVGYRVVTPQETPQSDSLSCPECKSRLIKSEGCERCPACDYAKCSL
jgi:hypothetical protein